MTRSTALLASCLVTFGCSANIEEADAVAHPVVVPTAKYDLSGYVLANGGVERIIDLNASTGPAFDEGCKVEIVEGCRFSVCPSMFGPSASESSTRTPVDVGTVTATSASLGSGVALENRELGLRLLQSGAFAEGETVRIVGTGSAAVAPFDLSVTIPPLIASMSFAGCSDPSVPCTVSDPAPVVAWTGGGDRFVGVSLRESADVRPHHALYCTFPAASRQGRIPAAAIAKLPRQWGYMVGISAFAPLAVATAGSGLKVGFGAARWRGASDPKLLGSITLPK